MSSRLRELFGGALTSNLPEGIIDASDLRQIPDTQEVFLFQDSDCSIIFEILEIVQEGAAGSDLQEAVKFHFSSLAHDNSAHSSSIDTISSPFPLPSTLSSSASSETPPSSSMNGSHTHLYCTLEGVQTVSKFNLPASEADLVKIYLGLIRVDLSPDQDDPSRPKRGADITVTVNVPLGKAVNVQAGEVDQGTRELEVKAKAWFEEAVGSFKIVDYGLFA